MRFLSQNQKRSSRFCICYVSLLNFFEKSLKSWLLAIARPLFGLGHEIYFLAIFDMKCFSISKIFFHVHYLLLRPYWSTIENIFTPQTYGTTEHFVYGVKNPIFSLKTKCGYHDCSFGPRAKLFIVGSKYV